MSHQDDYVAQLQGAPSTSVVRVTAILEIVQLTNHVAMHDSSEDYHSL